MDNRYVVAAILLIVPTVVLAIVPMYNRVDPEFLGLPFFYWFQALWLGIAALFYVIAGLLITSREREVEPA